LGTVSHLDAFSGYLRATSLPGDTPGGIARTRAVASSRSSRTKDDIPQHSTPTTDTDRNVSRRSEPSSCATLTGEQPDPWDLLHPQDVTSRHRGAKPRRRCELSGAISLLSPAYLLSDERWAVHTVPPDHLHRLSSLLALSRLQSGWLLRIHSTCDYRPH